MTAAASFDNHVSKQAIAMFGGGLIVLVITTVVASFIHMPYPLMMMLVVNNVILMLLQSYSVNCMVNGKCHIYAWIQVGIALFALLALLSKFITFSKVS